jgi:hypothetical protein
MFHPAEKHLPVQQPARAGRNVRAAFLLGALTGVILLGQAHAQMVPQPEHALRQATGKGGLTTIRINLNGSAASGNDEDRGRGLNLRGKGFWPQWEGRIGVVMDRQVNPLKDSYVLAQPAPNGLKLRSFHVLSDYYVDGGFRATAGLLRGNTGQAWWSSGDNGGGLNLSLQRLDTLDSLAGTDTRNDDRQTVPYVGAGFTSHVGMWGLSSAWRFNADVGLVSIGSGQVDSMSRMLQGDKSLDDMVRDLRFRPLVKVSVGYSF